MARHFFLLLALLVAQSSTTKPQESVKHDRTYCNVARSSNLTTLSNGKKYSFIQSYENWNSANETCAEMGLHLATLRDTKDAQVVAAEALKIETGPNWLVSARKSEGDFRWHDGTKLELNSTLWWGRAAKTHDCVYFYNWEAGKLNSYPCFFRFYVICELPTECY
ncbi:C-type lectin domain family 4 member D-like [Neocloeon triangulifer]|uniref:C-type lectin domain family 4 member D-like n=1 Tax=Neocloeon triangulifer TaxID=2078957 RepID=UPI00286ED35D|nr:C-type lectin domain family 4 member D-like [Neocloeon triangulifer]